ncbi:hypothetical protein [Natronorubrum halophilum]|uniref:hypothetical protein n=1 Tax=Natronorubrum halophilum TaxID=1702106 RepID=UPI0010C16919|nr:hypothetical protein [Natronorubrum halophilum]
MSRHHSHAFEATCSDCGTTKTAESPNELIECYRRHSRHTSHELVWTRADVAFELPAADDLERIVGELETHYEEGVPIGIVAAAMNDRGATIGETLESIREVRLTGALYEPRDDHVAVV